MLQAVLTLGQRLHFSSFLSTGPFLYFSLRGRAWCWTSPLLATGASLDWALHPCRLLSRMGSGLGRILGAQEIIQEERLQVVSARTGDRFSPGRETPGSWRVGQSKGQGGGRGRLMAEKLGAEEETWLWWKLEVLIEAVGMAAEGGSSAELSLGEQKALVGGSLGQGHGIPRSRRLHQ